MKMLLCILTHNTFLQSDLTRANPSFSFLFILHPCVLLIFPMIKVQEAEREEAAVISDTQQPRSAKKGKASASSTPQTGSDKKERKGKHKGQHVPDKTNGSWTV